MQRDAAIARGWLSWPGDALEAWVTAEQGRFLPWLPVCMGAGVVAYFAQTIEPHPAIGAVAACAALLACFATWRSMAARAASLCALAAALGFASAQFATWRALPIEPLPTRAVVLTGLVRGVEQLPDGRRITLDQVRPGPEAPLLARAIRVRLRRGDAVTVQAGDTMRVRALLRPPAPPALPGGWDLQRDAFFTGLGGSGTALNPAEIIARAPPQGVGWIQAIRDRVSERVIAGLPGSAGAVAATLLTGGTGAIPLADRAAFRDSGLAHLLAVAGLHIGIVMGLFMGVTRLGLALSERTALRWPTKPIAAVAALMGGAMYLLLTGGHLPILRSFAMACLVTLGLVLGRRALSLRGLAIAAVALMLAAPHEVVGVSFQMSFSAVLALISGYEALRPVLRRLYGPGLGRRFASHGVALVLTSLLAGTASAPYGAYHFGHFQLYFIAANVLAVPLTAFWVLPLGIAALALMPFGAEQVALVPMGWGLDGIIAIARTVAAWPEATWAVPPMPGWGLALFSVGLAWLGIWRTPARLLGVPVMLVGLLSPAVTPRPDILMSPDARLIAIRGGDGEYAVQNRSGSKFVLDAWRDHLAAGPLLPIRTGRPATCDDHACRLDVITLMRGSSRPSDCVGVGLLISAEPARDLCPRGVLYLDRFSVWRNGAHAVWLTPAGPVIVSDRDIRGRRPWVPPLPTPRRLVPNLPMAPAEELPLAAEE